MFTLILLLILLLVCIYFLTAPIYLEINSERELCRLRFHVLANAGLLMHEGSLMLELKIAGWKKQVDLFAGSTKRRKPIKQGMAGRKKNSSIHFRKIYAVIKSFKITKCDLSLDSGDMPLNGILFPIFQLISSLTGKNIRINFRDENKIIFEAENNLARLCWAFIKPSSFTHL